MGPLIDVIAPIFALIGLGAICVRLRLVEPAGLRGMTDVVFFGAMPALLFGSVAGAPELRLLSVALPFLVGAILLFVVAVIMARGLFGVRLAQASVFGLNAVFGNTVMMGIPVVDATYGSEGVANLLAVIAFHSAFLLPMASVLIEADIGGGRGGPFGVLRAIVPGILRNPIVMSIVIAFAWRATGLTLPLAATRFVNLVGAAGPPLALFCLGASLPRRTGGEPLRDVAVCTLLKLVVLPALVALLAWAVGLHGTAFSVVVIAAGLPTGANAFMLARRAATYAEASAATVVASTALAMVTLSALLIVLG